MGRHPDPNTLRLNSNVWTNFIDDLNSKATKITYQACIRKYMYFLKYTDGDVSRLLNGGDSAKIQTQIMDFLRNQRNGGADISANTLKAYYTALKSFFEFNDVIAINWRKVRKTVGRTVNRANNDRPYTHQEIQKLLSYADERKRVVLLLMASSGMRVGSISGLKLRDLQGIPEHKLYQITVYSDSEHDRYITFCTPECADSICEYFNYRQRSGETLKPDAPVIREQFNVIRGTSVQNPKTLSTETIDNEIYDLVYRAGLRDRNNKKVARSGDRYEMMITHALRKHFRTQCEFAGLNTLHVEILMGHDTGLQAIYFKPRPADLLKEYLKAIPHLTINEESKLKKKVETLTIERNRFEAKLDKIDQLAKKLGITDEE
jgi:integrase